MLEVKCPDHLAAAREFAAANGLAEQLQSQLDYLDKYGSAAGGNKCILASDFAPHSFAFAVYRPCPEDRGGWRWWFSGGLIFQGPNNPADGSFPSLTVSLAEGVGWFVHT